MHFLRKSMKVLSVGDISNGAMHGRMFCIWACWCSVSTVLRSAGSLKLSGTWLTKRRGIPQGALRTTWRSIPQGALQTQSWGIPQGALQTGLVRTALVRTTSMSMSASLLYWAVSCSTPSGKPIRGISSLTACYLCPTAEPESIPESAGYGMGYGRDFINTFHAVLYLTY